MRTDLPFVRHAFLQALRSAAATPVTLKWREWSGTVTIDPVTGSKTGTSSVRTAVVRGLFHVVQPSSSPVRLYNEVEVGDAILDLAPEVVLDGRDELTFEIAGQLWVQKPVSTQLATTWETAGQKIYRTVLLRRAS